MPEEPEVRSWRPLRLIAGLGGYFFVLSGFSAGGLSMQMGGSFLGSYAFAFITLWYTK